MHGGDGGGFRWVLLWISDGVNLIGWTLVGFWIQHGWTLVLLGSAVFFFFLICFVSVGFWWAVGSGGVVGMVEARWWWLGSGGVMIEVKGRWRRKLEKNKNGKNIFYCVDILF